MVLCPTPLHTTQKECAAQQGQPRDGEDVPPERDPPCSCPPHPSQDWVRPHLPQTEKLIAALSFSWDSTAPCSMLNPDQQMEKAEFCTYWSHTTWARPLIRKSMHLWANHPQHWVTVYRSHLWSPRNPVCGHRITGHKITGSGWKRPQWVIWCNLSARAGLSQSTWHRMASTWFLNISMEVSTVLQGPLLRKPFGGVWLGLYFWELCTMHLQWIFLICQAFKWEKSPVPASAISHFVFRCSPTQKCSQIHYFCSFFL